MAAVENMASESGEGGRVIWQGGHRPPRAKTVGGAHPTRRVPENSKLFVSDWAAKKLNSTTRNLDCADFEMS